VRIHSHETVTRFQVAFDERETETLLAHPEWKLHISTKMAEHNGHQRLRGAAQLTRGQINDICDVLGINGREFMAGVYVGELPDTTQDARITETRRELAEQRAENGRLMSIVGQAMNPPVPTDMRADYIAAHLWLTKHGVAMLKDGKPATLTERVRMLLELADGRGERLERMEPIASLLADWEFAEIDRHDLARDDRLADRVCDALKAVEEAEKKAKEAGRG
jgi:hypothetical protein